MLTKGAQANGRLSHELIENVRAKYGYKCIITIRRIWAKYQASIIAGEGFSLKRKEGSGCPLKHSADNLSAHIREVPMVKRKTLRSLLHHSGIPKSTLLNYLQRGLINRRTSSIKPSITPAGRQKRVDWCMSFIGPDGRSNDLMDWVHVDKKWFYIQPVDALQAVVDENIDWEDVTADLTWGDDVDHAMEEVLM